MPHQPWLPLGVSTLVVSTVASIAFVSAKPVAVIVASTAGVAGGFLLSNLPAPPRQLSHRSVQRFSNSESDLGPNLGFEQQAFLNQPIVSELARFEGLLEKYHDELVALKAKVHQQQSLGTEAGTTAIFYDIENLLKGYSFSYEEITNLSLKDILSAICQTGKVGQVAVQKAYANWSDSRLRVMRGEINELGIEPIQVFGFSYEPKKNAADIQLAIDAIELTYLRPSISTFTIISGDGGFSALTNKLHEHGKQVIGCAYKNSASKTFQAVCDDFIWILDPNEAGPTDSLTGLNVAISKPINSFDPRNAQLITQIKKTTSTSPEEIEAKTHEILSWYAKSCHFDLSTSGIFLSVVQQAVGYLIPEFQSIYWGFAKFVEYMQYICQGSEFQIARVPPSMVILALRCSPMAHAEILPDLVARDIHSVDTYRSLLGAGRPIYHLPPPDQLAAIINYLVEHPLSQTDFGIAVENLAIALIDTVPAETVEAALRSFASAGILIRELEGVKLAEQKLSLQADIRSASEMINRLRDAVIQKLMSTDLPRVETEVVQQLLPEIS